MASLDVGSLSVARARRRPARYSPELLPAASQQQQQSTDMCIGGSAAPDTAEDTAAQIQQELEQHELEQLREQENAGNRALLLRNGSEMAPAALAKRSKHKAKRKYKKKQCAQNVLDDPNAKRPRVANVLLENEMLIDEIRERKALWMRTHEQHHSAALTTPLWDEIAKVLDTTQEGIRRRWKSLKDHYRRELKKSMTDATAPPSAWPYYKKMRFMKSQMFVSLRRKNGEDHLEILSDDEEDINGQWNGQCPRKQEGGSDTMDDYEMAEEYNEMFKYEQHMQQLQQDDLDGAQEEEEEEEEEEDEQQQQQQEEQVQGQEELSPIPSLHDQEELTALQQQAELSELSTMSAIQQQSNVISTEMGTMTTIAEMVGIPNIVTTTASSLTGRLSSMQQRTDLSGRLSSIQQRGAAVSDIGEAIDAMNRSNSLTGMQEPREINDSLEDMNARHTALQQQRAQINGRLSAMQRNVEMSAMQQRSNIAALHERAEMTAMQQRAQMQQRNGVVENGIDNSNVSPIIGDDRGGISDDYHFFMSLMPHVRNFTSLQKLKVRNRIQQIIIEEASNCQYDPLGNC